MCSGAPPRSMAQDTNTNKGKNTTDCQEAQQWKDESDCPATHKNNKHAIMSKTDTEESTTTADSDSGKLVKPEVGVSDNPAVVTTSAESSSDEEKKEEKSADVEEKEAAKKKYENWPMKNISEPHDHDVLYGRGGGTNHHPGNKRYRKMVEDKKLDYVNSKRLDKPLVALEIIKGWREQVPPGRFLKLDEKTGLWFDVGDKKAREKTSQALREKAPLIRKQQEEERMGHDDGGGDGDAKTTRFAEGTKDGNSSSIKRPGLARDTSLGPIAAEKDVSLNGFSWQDGIGSGEGDDPRTKRIPSSTPQQPQQPYQPPSPYRVHSGGLPPPELCHYRYGSHGSMGPHPPPPPGGSYGPNISGDERRMQFSSSGRFESWGSLPPPGPMPPTPLQSGGSWGAPEHGMTSREHSLSQFPLPHASIVHPAQYATFDGRVGTGPYAHSYPPPSAYGPPAYHYSSSGPAPPGYPQPPNGYRGHARTPSNSHSIDLAVASAWSGQPEAQIVKKLSDEDFELEKNASSPARPSALVDSKPELIKRATSNQNETVETKPDRVGASVKRAALNRDSSRASNRLKEISFPGQFTNGKFDATKEMNELSEDMNRSRLSADRSRPVSISEDDRTTTLDYLSGSVRPDVLDGGGRTSSVDLVAMDLAVKPNALGSSSRSSTIEGLALDVVDDVLVKPEVAERTTTMDFVIADLQKPGAIGLDNRMTTTDFLEIVNEPLAEDDPSIFSGKRQAV